jgi:hypothetical protein
VQHPERAAVGDDDDLPGPFGAHGAARPGGQPRRELVREPGHPAVEIAEGFPSVRPRVRIDHALAGQPAGRRPDRGGGGALEHAQASLPQPGVAGHDQPERLRERRGGLAGAAQVADVQRADRPVAQPGRDRPGLAQAQPGQPGLVAVPLGQAEGVPGALAVPDEPENRAVRDRAVTDAGDPIGYIRYTRKRAPAMTGKSGGSL